MQLVGTLLCLVMIGVLTFQTRDSGLRGVLIGAGIGVVFLVARNAWQLEKKAARAQWSEIGIGKKSDSDSNDSKNGFHFTDSKNQTQFILWENIETREVRGGRLYLAWRDEKNKKNELQFGAREVENGMELIQLLASRGASTPASDDGFEPPSNFIPLAPK